MIKNSLIVILNEVWLYLFNKPCYSPVFKKDEEKLENEGVNISKRDRIWWNKKGFLSDKALIYDIDKVEYYVSDLERRILTERINKFNRIIVHDKYVFYRFLSPRADLIPVVILIQKSGRLDFIDSDIRSADSFLEEIYNGKEFIVKPAASGGGKDVVSINYSQDKGKFIVGNHEFNPDQFLKYLSEMNRSVIQPKIFPSGYSKEIYPHSLNTMRVITMLEPDTNEPFVAAVSHKFGTSKAGVIDNWKQGGFLVYVDESTGELGHGALYPINESKIKFDEYHPDSSVRIKGYQIPNWEEFINQMKALATELELLAFVGWDVAWDGNKVLVIEANYNPDMSIIQCFNPLLEKEKVKYFFKNHGLTSIGL